MSGRRIGLRIVTLADVGTTLTLSAPTSVIEGESFQATGRLTRDDTGQGIPSESVVLSLDGSPLSSANTDSSGYYAFNVTIYDPGNYTLMASYSGGTCVYGCELSCETICEASCQTGCEVSCESACQVSCQTTCELQCEDICEISCQDVCEVSCQTGCEVSCQDACELGVHCETTCEYNLACEISCQTTCEFECQTVEWQEY